MGNTMDRSELIGGIWDNDLDKYPEKEYNFTSVCGYECVIRRNMQWAYCGYVQLPKDHPYYDKNYNEIDDIYVHGDLTYSADGLFGFDCYHITDGDISPVDETMRAKHPDMFPKLSMFNRNPPHYWTFEDAKRETENMAKQFFDIANK